jgi:hypothetical protein
MWRVAMSVIVSLDLHWDPTTEHVKISMNVKVWTSTTVLRNVSTKMDNTAVSVSMDTHWIQMVTDV